MNGYRLGLGCLVGVLFAGQFVVRHGLTGTTRTFVGYGVTLGFFLALAEFATLALGHRLARRWGLLRKEETQVRVVSVLMIASLLLLLDLFSKTLSPYLALAHRPPPTIPLLIVAGFWLVMIGRARRPGAAASCCLLGLTGLVLGTRLLVLWASRLDPQRSDMLPTIDRALDELLAGRFPYVDFPPRMPYLPGMFLAYLPPKLLGVDLRLSNLVLEVASAVIAIKYAASARVSGGPGAGARQGGRWLPVDQLALPLLMLHPTWINYSVNSQFAPSVLTTVLLGLAIVGARPRAQAGALGLALGSSQMLLATGPIVFAFWLRQHGWRRAVRLSALTSAVFLTIVAPFLLWNPGQFVGVAFGSREALPVEVMSGRFTLLPLFVGVLPHPDLLLTTLVIGVGAIAGWRARSPEEAVAAMALGLCAALLVQPVSFTHYFLPALALAAIATGGSRSRTVPQGGLHLSKSKTVKLDCVMT